MKAVGSPFARACLSAAIVMALALSSMANAKERSEFVPEYEIDGTWINDGDTAHPAPVVRTGREVRGSYVTPYYVHSFIGRYERDGTIVGIQTRVKTDDHTSTRMRLHLTFETTDSVRVDWVALDSRSDLPKGITGVAHLVRAQPPPFRKEMD